MRDPKPRIAIVDSHPIQYHAPVLTELARRDNYRLKVFYCSAHGVKAAPDEYFGAAFKWDIPLLEGYEYEFMTDRPKGPGLHFYPSMVWKLRREGYAALMIWGGYYTPMMVYSTVIGRMLGLRIVYRGDNYINPTLSRSMRLCKYLYLRTIMGFVNHVIATGTWSLQAYFDCGIPSRKLTVGPYVVNNSLFLRQAAQYAGRNADLKKELGIPAHRCVIGLVGKYHSPKRHQDLMRAAALLGNPDFHLLLVGDGPLREAIDGLARDLKIDDRVTLTGFVNQGELGKYYMAMDIFVVCSTHNPWITVVNEAMCFGLPLVLSDAIGAQADLLRDGENGFLYKMGDTRALANAIGILQASPELRHSFGEKSRRRIAEWAVPACADGFEQAFSKALSGR